MLLLHVSMLTLLSYLPAAAAGDELSFQEALKCAMAAVYNQTRCSSTAQVLRQPRLTNDTAQATHNTLITPQYVFTARRCMRSQTHVRPLQSSLLSACRPC